MPLILTPRQLIHRAQFYQQLGQLIAAGIGVMKALEMTGRNPPARSFREPIRQMILELSHGATVAGAMRSLGRWMPSFDVALIEAGERSGRLDAVFRLLAGYYDDRARLLRQMISDLAYPVFVFHFAIFLFPFITFFSDGNGKAYLLKTFGVLIPIYAVIFTTIYSAQGRRGEDWRSFLERLLRPVPVLGTARQYLALSRLAASLEALLNAGVTVIEAWEMAAAACGSPALLRAVTAWKPEVVEGQTPAEAIRASNQFPELFVNLYYSGEISGQLDDSLRQLQAYYQEEGSRKLHALGRWFAQFIYLCVMGMVAYLVIGFYVGYFNQIKAITGP